MKTPNLVTRTAQINARYALTISIPVPRAKDAVNAEVHWTPSHPAPGELSEADDRVIQRMCREVGEAASKALGGRAIAVFLHSKAQPSTGTAA